MLKNYLLLSSVDSKLRDVILEQIYMLLSSVDSKLLLR